FHCFFINPLIILDSNGPAPGLPRQKEINTAFSASIVQKRISFPDISAVCQTLQNRIRRRLIWIPVLVCMRIISPGCADLQQLVPFFLFHIRSEFLPDDRVHAGRSEPASRSASAAALSSSYHNIPPQCSDNGWFSGHREGKDIP